MDPAHRRLITENLSALVNLTTEKNLEDLLDQLYQNGVMSEEMVERNKTLSGDIRNRVREFYLDLQRRGPEAFPKLINILYTVGHWHISEILEPNRVFKKTEQTFHSLKRSPITTKELPPVEPIKTAILDVINDEKIEPIIVKKSAVFNNNSNNLEIPCYIMKSRNRGVLLMFNNIEFNVDVDEKKREGAEIDGQNLKSLFDQIGFETSQMHTNLEKEEFHRTLNSFRQSPLLKQTECLFVVVASHGSSNKSETSVICKDGGKIKTMEIIDYFNSEKCPALHKIPKVFIFQLCRGDSPDYGYSSSVKKKDQILRKPEKSDRTQFDGKVTNVIMRTYCDMLIVHSTVPGFQSHRDKLQGSWYFISMCKIFMNHCHNMHLEDLFKLIDNDLKDIKLKQNTVQTSAIENWGFNKHCYLNPGLFDNSE